MSKRRRRTARRCESPCGGLAASLPGEGAAVSVEAAAGPVVGEVDGPEDAGGAVMNGPAAGSAHVGGDPAGTDAVDQDAVGTQFGGEHAGEGVESGFGGAVGGDAAAHGGE